MATITIAPIATLPAIRVFTAPIHSQPALTVRLVVPPTGSLVSGIAMEGWAYPPQLPTPPLG